MQYNLDVVHAEVHQVARRVVHPPGAHWAAAEVAPARVGAALAAVRLVREVVEAVPGGDEHDTPRGVVPGAAEVVASPVLEDNQLPCDRAAQLDGVEACGVLPAALFRCSLLYSTLFYITLLYFTLFYSSLLCCLRPRACGVLPIAGVVAHEGLGPAGRRGVAPGARRQERLRYNQ